TGEEGHVILPQEYFDLAKDKEANLRFIAIKVDAGFDWATQLQDARLRTTGGQISLDAPNCPDSMSVKLSESTWCKTLCLVPEKQGKHKLLVRGEVGATLQLVKNTSLLQKSDGVALQVSAAQAAVTESRQAAQAARLLAEAKTRGENRRRCNLATLRAGLCGVDWPMTPELEPIFAADVWDGNGEPPKPPGAAATPASTQLEALEEMGALLKVSPQVKAEVESVPVAFWSTSRLKDKESLAKIEFKRFALKSKKGGGKRYQLKGQIEDAPDLKLRGTQAKQPQPPFGRRMLIGVLKPGTKKLLLFESEVYNVEIQRATAEEWEEQKRLEEEALASAVAEGEATPTQQKGYRDKRKKVIEDFGTAKKLRVFTTIAERLDRKCEVVELEKYAGHISAKIDMQEASKTSIEDKDAETKRLVLPPYNIAAEEPKDIYADGLKAIVYEQIMLAEKDLVHEPLAEFLKQNPKKVLKLSIEEALPLCQTHLSLAILRARADQGAETCQDPYDLARKLAVLNILLTLHLRGLQQKRGKCSQKHVAELLVMPVESQLVRHLHQTYYEQTIGQRNVRQFVPRKAICALVIWALHLTPNLSFDTTKDLEQEMKLERGMLHSICEYVGCGVETKNDGNKTYFLRITLKEAPKFNRKVYDAQTRESKQKGR
ncbi:unnamed protein product, partial [Polarella glacialis]